MKSISFFNGLFFDPIFLDPFSSWNEHIPFASVLVRLLRPRVLVELGVYKGASYLSFCQIVREENIPCVCYGVDSWRGDKQTSYYGDALYNELCQKHARYDTYSELLRMTFDEASPRFGSNTIDLLHIDGLHTYDAVRKDYETWLPKVSSRGIVLFHDTAIHRDDFGVWKLWQEIQEDYPSFQFPFGCGLGVLLVGSDVPNECKELLHQLTEQKELIKCFETCGCLLAHRAQVDKLRSDVAILEQNVTTYREVLKSSDDENNDKTQHIKNLDEHIDEISEHIKEMESNTKKLEMCIAKDDEEINELQKTIQSLHVDIQDKDKYSHDLQKQYQLYKDQYDSLSCRSSVQILLKIIRFRDALLPPESRRRTLAQMVYFALRHPSRIVHKIRWKTLRGFFHLLANGNFALLKERWRYHFDHETSSLAVPSNNPLDYLKDIGPFSFDRPASPLVSVLIPVYNQYEYTKATLLSLAANTRTMSLEVLLLDDASPDTRIATLADDFPGLYIIRNKTNVGFLQNVNAGARQAKGQYIYLLNNDVLINQDTVQALVRTLETHPEAGAVGSRLVYPNGQLQEAGGIVFKDGSAWNYGRNDDPGKSQYTYLKPVDYASGASLLIRRNDWETLGGFDPAFAPAYAEDTDFAFRLRQHGKTLLYQPQSVLTHFEGVSHGTDTASGLKAYQTANLAKLGQRHAEILQAEHAEHGKDIFLARDRSVHKPHLLFVDHYVPQHDKDAGSRSARLYLELLVELGFMVHFVPDNHHNDVQYTTDLQQLGIEVLYDTPSEAFHWKSWIQENGKYIQVAILSRPHIAINYIDDIKKYSNAKIIYFAHDLQHLSLNCKYTVTRDKTILQQCEKFKQYEQQLTAEAHESWLFSVDEAEYLKKEGFTPSTLAIPLFFYETIPPVPIADRQQRECAVCFVAGFRHPPNADALLWFGRDIWPLVLRQVPTCRFLVGGAFPPNEAETFPNTELLGYLSDMDLEALYQRVRVSVVPLRYGAGVKGKTIEALCRGLPVVGTRFAAEGVAGLDQVVQIATEAQEFANTLVRLIEDEASWNETSRLSLAFCSERFSRASAVELLRKHLFP